MFLRTDTSGFNDSTAAYLKTKMFIQETVLILKDVYIDWFFFFLCILCFFSARFAEGTIRSWMEVKPLKSIIMHYQMENLIISFLTRPGTCTEYCAAVVLKKKFPLFTLKLGQRSKTSVRGMNSGRQQPPSSSILCTGTFQVCRGLLFDIENIGFWRNIPLN